MLALDVKPFTYSPRNVFLPMFRKPFDGEMVLSNWFDHNLPFEFIDNNGVTVSFAGETSPFGIDGHNGYDFRMPEGTPLLAVAAGTVTFAGAETPFACPVLTAVGVRDDVNPNNEFVELTLDTRFNSGNATRSLTGYTLRNNGGDTYAFPVGTVIREGQPVRVYTGPGVNGEAALFWGRSSGVWNNFGDCAQLFAPNGSRRYRLSFLTACP